jgi:ABC-type sugar transport system ATPase subunit
MRQTSLHGWRRPRVERRLAAHAVELLRIRTRGLDAAVETLSGGNQQKVVFGRWLDQDVRLLLLDDPTVGVDVGAKAEIHSLISQLAAQGSAVLLASSELPELLSLADRLLIMRGGRIVAELAGPAMTEENALALALGGTHVAH